MLRSRFFTESVLTPRSEAQRDALIANAGADKAKAIDFALMTLDASSLRHGSAMRTLWYTRSGRDAFASAVQAGNNAYKAGDAQGVFDAAKRISAVWARHQGTTSYALGKTMRALMPRAFGA